MGRLVNQSYLELPFGPIGSKTAHQDSWEFCERSEAIYGAGRAPTPNRLHLDDFHDHNFNPHHDRF
jgi:hypothetical protein